jgi:hypothetical protein
MDRVTLTTLLEAAFVAASLECKHNTCHVWPLHFFNLWNEFHSLVLGSNPLLQTYPREEFSRPSMNYWNMPMSNAALFSDASLHGCIHYSGTSE